MTRSFYRTLAGITLVLSLMLLAPKPAGAVTFWSWNLSRDMATLPTTSPSNPIGAWTFVQASSLTGPWTALPNYMTGFNCGNSWFACWNNGPQSIPMAGYSTVTGTTGFPGFNAVSFTREVPILHPGVNTHVAVKWTNPFNFSLAIQVLARVTDLDPNGGNGVKYHVLLKNGATWSTLTTGAVQSSGSTLTGNAFSPTAVVDAGQSVYFVIDPNGNYDYDSTELDLLITGRVYCAIPCD